jgi:Na+/proline symporter
MFLALSYFGTDQSQVQRYISGASLRESRLGLMFNAVCKIPMQFFILLLGAMLAVFYRFEQPPVYFNETAWKIAVQHDPTGPLPSLAQQFADAHAQERDAIQRWLDAKHTGTGVAEAREAALVAEKKTQAVRADAQKAMRESEAGTTGNDDDYVFITFILRHLPHGLIGLLVAAFFAAALSSKAAELNALGSTTTVDLYRHIVKRSATDAHYVAASKGFTIFWGLVAIGFALFANLMENLIQAVNILGSIFYGVVLGIFVAAFFFRRIGGTAIFWAAIAAQLLVFALYFTLSISYLWYNIIGCAACVLFGLALQAMIGPTTRQRETLPTS